MKPLYIVINRHRIFANRKKPVEEHEPVVRVTRGKHGKPVYCDTYTIHGPSTALNGHGEGVMPCGATFAITTSAPVTLFTRDGGSIELPGDTVDPA